MDDTRSIQYKQLQYHQKPYQICYRQIGQNRPYILYIHGWSHSHRIWEPIISTLATTDDYTHIAVDLPGFGNSTVPHGFDYALHSFGECLGDFVSQIPEKPFAIIAHSMGGLVALSNMMQKEIGFLKIAICGSPLAGLPFLRPLFYCPGLVYANMALRALLPNFALKHAGHFTIARHNFHKITREFIEDIRKASAETMTRCLKNIAFCKLPETSYPNKDIILIRGEKEIVLTKKVAETYARAWNAPLITLPGVSHTYALEDPHLFGEILRRFLYADASRTK